MPRRGRFGHVQEKNLTVLDEWTSVVDRTVAKIMSYCIQKYARRNAKKIVLCSCHYDVIEWLNPDWIIDCNEQRFIDRRNLRPEERERKEKLALTVQEIGKETWQYFSKFHYLNERMVGGLTFFYGLFLGVQQIGFCCFANYVPKRRGKKTILHANRVVIHPDYVGLGLGPKMVNAGANYLHKKGYRIMSKFSSIPTLKNKMKDPRWKLKSIQRQIGKTPVGFKMERKTGFRENIKTYSYEFIG